MSVRGLLHSQVAWVAATALAPAGIVAYLVIGGSLWWWLGVAAVAPLVGLMFGRLAEDEDQWAPATGGDGPGALLRGSRCCAGTSSPSPRAAARR